jgi:hypothetical protein
MTEDVREDASFVLRILALIIFWQTVGHVGRVLTRPPDSGTMEGW